MEVKNRREPKQIDELVKITQESVKKAALTVYGYKLKSMFPDYLGAAIIAKENNLGKELVENAALLGIERLVWNEYNNNKYDIYKIAEELDVSKETVKHMALDKYKELIEQKKFEQAIEIVNRFELPKEILEVVSKQANAAVLEGAYRQEKEVSDQIKVAYPIKNEEKEELARHLFFENMNSHDYLRAISVAQEGGLDPSFTHEAALRYIKYELSNGSLYSQKIGELEEHINRFELKPEEVRSIVESVYASDCKEQRFDHAAEIAYTFELGNEKVIDAAEKEYQKTISEGHYLKSAAQIAKRFDLGEKKITFAALLAYEDAISRSSEQLYNIEEAFEIAEEYNLDVDLFKIASKAKALSQELRN